MVEDEGVALAAVGIREAKARAEDLSDVGEEPQRPWGIGACGGSAKQRFVCGAMAGTERGRMLVMVLVRNDVDDGKNKGERSD